MNVKLKLAILLILAFIGLNTWFLTHIPLLRVVGTLLIIFSLITIGYYMKYIPEIKRKKNLDEKFIYFLSFKGRLLPLFPVIGVGLITTDIYYNLFLTSVHEFLTLDYLVLTLGVVLIMYNYIPEKYSYMKNFIFIISFLSAMFLSAPLGIWKILTQSYDIDPEWYTYWFISAPTSAIANIFGAHSSASGRDIIFQHISGDYIVLSVSRECAGINSVVLFSAGFIAFVLVEYKIMDRFVIAMLFSGILTAYISNLLRLTIIIMVGVHYDTETMMRVHDNIGILIFIALVSLFWYLTYKYIDWKKHSLYCMMCGKRVDSRNIPNKCPRCSLDFHIGKVWQCTNCGKIFKKRIPKKCPICGIKFLMEEE